MAALLRPAAGAVPLTPPLLGICLISGNAGQWPVWLVVGLTLDLGRAARERMRAA